MHKVLQSNKAYKLSNEKQNNKINARFAVIQKKYNRELDKNYMFVFYVQNRGFFVADFNLGTIFSLSFKIEKFVSAIEIINLIDEFKTILFIFGDKKGKLLIIRRYDGKYDSVFVDNLHNGTVSTIKFNETKMNALNGNLNVENKSDLFVKHNSCHTSEKEMSVDQITPEDQRLKKTLGSDLSSTKKMLIFDDNEVDELEKIIHQKSKEHEAAIRDTLKANDEQVKMGTSDVMIASGSLDRTIKILIIRNALKPEKLTPKSVYTFLSLRHRYRIAEISWDPFDSDRFLTVCQKHVAVQVWTINPRKNAVLKQDEEKVERNDKDLDPYYVSSIRGHKGFITTATWSQNERNCVLTCSDDQSIKLWNLINIRCRQPPAPRKNEIAEEEIYEEDQPRESDRREYDGYRKNVSKLDSYKQKGSEKPARYRIESEDDDDDDYTPYYKKSEN